jgi:hypothetical protein
MRIDPEISCPTIQKSSLRSSSTYLIHPYGIKHLTIGAIKLMANSEFAREKQFDISIYMVSYLWAISRS